jgi:predicted regulator of Ras-like GTPase activity (Roadblock/LC7/MglB family)
MDLKDDRLFREIMTQVQGVRCVQLITREGVIIQSLFADEVTELDLSMVANNFISACEHVLVSLNLMDMKQAIIQANDGYFMILNFEDESYLVFNIHSTAPLNVISGQILHILERQVPLWRHKVKSE